MLSILVPPERLGLLLALDPADVEPVVLSELERMYGPAAQEAQAVHLRLWATDPFTRGYVTHWWPGDVLRVGSAARDARPAVLRVRLRPVDGRLHGGRGAGRACGRRSGAGRMTARRG